MSELEFLDFVQIRVMHVLDSIERGTMTWNSLRGLMARIEDRTNKLNEPATREGECKHGKDCIYVCNEHFNVTPSAATKEDEIMSYIDRGPFTMSRYANQEDLYEAMHAHIDRLEREVDYLLDAISQAKPQVIEALKQTEASWIWSQIEKLKQLRGRS